MECESVTAKEVVGEDKRKLEGGENRSVRITEEKIQEYIGYLGKQGRVKGTMEWYGRGLRHFYRDLDEDDKTVYRETLKNWRERLVGEGYAAATVNQFMVVVNGFLDYLGAREFQVSGKLEKVCELRPELSREEYLQLLRRARELGRERVYLLVKVFANTGYPVQELPKLTVEAVRKGRVQIRYNGMKQVVRLPECIVEELMSYIRRQGIERGPIFLTRDGEPMSRTNVTTGIRQLCLAAGISEAKGSPRCLRRHFQATRESISRSISLLVEQSQNRMLEDEQLMIAWEVD